MEESGVSTHIPLAVILDGRRDIIAVNPEAPLRALIEYLLLKHKILEHAGNYRAYLNRYPLDLSKGILQPMKNSEDPIWQPGLTLCIVHRSREVILRPNPYV